MSYNYTYKLALFLLMMLMCIQYAKKSTNIGWKDRCPIQETHTTSHFIYNAYKIIECGKINYSGVANFHVELSCAIDDLKI